ncbi:MAG: CHAT domain-containing protein, partial [Deltaproteobacteria bacterium]|nr:CHAT domain-containing protein [Deltaproteobacteria bacterium]
GTPHLWLEKESGDADVVNGDNLVTRLKELQERPRLVVLASCQSAGSGVEARSGDEGALAALGPRLAEAGIPAVLAMQGNITMQTVAQFMPTFFSELQRDGQIDRAMAAARGAVRDRPDWWMPVLFMRLKSGRLWYTPGFAGEKGGLEKWPALIRNIKRGRATPILGMGLTESLLGSTREIAQRWADTYHFPMAPHDREDL